MTENNPEEPTKQPRLALVLNPRIHSAQMYLTDDIALDNIAPYRGRVGKIIGEYLAKDPVYEHRAPMLVLEFDDGKQFAFYTSMLTILE